MDQQAVPEFDVAVHVGDICGVYSTTPRQQIEESLTTGLIYVSYEPESHTS